MTYNLPIKVRDEILNKENSINIPTSALETTKLINKVEKDGDLASAIDELYQKPISASTQALLMKLGRNTQSNSINRNKARVCTFWQRGACDRGSLCPFLHEDLHKDSSLKNQDIKSRYSGTGDVYAEKLLQKADKMMQKGQQSNLIITAPSDPTITTLFIDLNPIYNPKNGLLDENKIPTKPAMIEALGVLFAPYGTPIINAITNPITQQNQTNDDDIRTKLKSSFATVQFDARQQAETAINELGTSVSLFDSNIRLNWSNRSQVPPPPPPLPPPPPSFSQQSFAVPPPPFGFVPPPPPPPPS
jgi:hypothetical protein